MVWQDVRLCVNKWNTVSLAAHCAFESKRFLVGSAKSVEIEPKGGLALLILQPCDIIKIVLTYNKTST